MIILFVLAAIIGIFIFYFYRKAFENNVQRALSNKSTLKLPDLNDVLITYIVFSIIVIFSLAMHGVTTSYNLQVTNCIEHDIQVQSLSKEYDFCINDFGNIIFVDQKNALSAIENEYKELVEELNNETQTYSSNDFDNRYWKLQNSRSTDERKELYLLYSIYLNYYETKYIDLEYERVK